MAVTILDTINGWIWNPLAYIALALGLMYTVVTKGVQFTRLPDMFKQIRESEAGDGSMSSFQAMAMSLSSRVGVGSIAGVATAIAAGGPGALFWMVITALVGATTVYAEAVLSQLYKRKVGGEIRGGMPFYIKYGLRAPVLAAVVSAVSLMSYGFITPGIQANNIGSSFELAFNLEPWVTGIIITTMLAIVIVGGTKRIVSVTQSVIPFMSIGYVLLAFVIVVINIEKMPEMFMMILSSAFGQHQIFGGIAGYAVMWGVRRAVFACAIGFGEGTYAAAAAETSHPAKQGIVQAFSIYVDILLICMATGTMILVTDSFHVLDPAGGFLVNHVPGAVAGPNFVQHGIDTSLAGWGPAAIAVAVFLFAFSSQVFFFYVASTNLVFLLQGKSSKFWESMLKLGALAISFIGCTLDPSMMWALGDVGYGLLTWLNMAVLVIMTPVVAKVVRDFDRQRKLGLDPDFNPFETDIQGAVYWENRQKEKEQEPAIELDENDLDKDLNPARKH